ncbi:MAG: hypothetical protein KatS3mg010_0243 [Acidimicrobiia bacterium]|nr:MAG: hypothetical protein KatS3mg010_0243 [Acidimicrobiia bacterium]
MTRSLSGRVVVVTGADAERGERVARAVAAAGANVVLVGDDPARLASLASELPGVRVAVFAGGADDRALIEMVDELFPR